ncbi:MAG: DUF4154 domain-containing protein [Chitinivibrionales bacterium]|nr:DUF4154 domain-containing protein [Chitinivibrionales bacterium]
MATILCWHKGGFMERRVQRIAWLAFAILLAFCTTAFTGTEKAPEKVQAALFMKLLAFHKGIASGGDVVVYVAAASDFAAELRKGIGKKIGSAELVSVIEGNETPTEKPSVIYIGSEELVDSLTSYTRTHDLLSITGIPGLVERGISLGVGTQDGKPTVRINTTASKEESAEWDAAIFKIATTVK